MASVSSRPSTIVIARMNLVLVSSSAQLSGTEAARSASGPVFDNAAMVRIVAGSKSSPASDSAPITSYHVAKTLREAAEAKMANLRLAEMERKLIDKDRASAGAFTAFRQLRDALGVLPRKVAPAAAVATDVREVETLIARAIREALDLFANRTLPELLAAVGADAADAGEDASP